MEPQKTPHEQHSPKNKDQCSGDFHLRLLQKHSNKNTGTESDLQASGTRPKKTSQGMHSGSHLAFDKNAKTRHWETMNLQPAVLEKLDVQAQKNEIGPLSIALRKA